MTQEQFNKQFPDAKKTSAANLSRDGLGKTLAIYDNGYYQRTWHEPHSEVRVSDNPIAQWLYDAITPNPPQP